MSDLLNMQNILGSKDLCILLFNNLFFNLLFSYLEISLFVSLFKINATNKSKVQFILLYTVFNFLLQTLLISPYVKIITAIIGICLLKLLFKNSIEKCILGQILNSTINICFEILFSKIFAMLLGNIVNYKSGFYNLKYAFLLMLSISVIKIIILELIKSKKIVLNIKENLTLENKYTIIVITTISYLMIILNLLQINIQSSNMLYIVFLINIFAIAIYFIINLRNVIKIAMLEEYYNKIHTLESYNKTLSIMYDNIRGFKHDFSNFVQALDGYVKTNDIDGIRTLSEGILKDCVSTNNLEILDPTIINNSAIYSIITNKYYLAQEQNIVMNIEVMVDLNEINISNYDICRILAILLDNAIEAASECKDKRVINLKILKDLKVNRKLLIVENSYIDSGINIDQIFEKDFTTKGDKSNKEHGLGLWNVRKILNHKENLNLFTQKGELFLQQLEIYE